MTYIPGTPGSPNTPPSSGNNPGTPDMPWSAGDRPKWSIYPGESTKDIENEYKNLVQWLQDNPKNMYNGGLALLQFTLQIGQIIKQGGSQAADLTSFMNNQLSGPDGDLMAMIIDMAAEGDAVQNGQAHADDFINQLTSELNGLKGFGPTFATMYQEASYMSDDNDSGLNSWISENQVTYTDPFTHEKVTYWINPQTGQPMTNFNFTDWANAAAFPLGTLINSSNTTDYINNMYQDQIDQIFASTKNPWERMMQLLALVQGRMSDLGTQMNGLSGNLASLSKANKYVADMQNMLKTPTAANMQQFYQDFHDLKALIGTDPMLASLMPNLDSVEGIFNGNTAAFPGATVGDNGSYTLPENKIVVFTPTGGSPEYMVYTRDATGGKITCYRGLPAVQANQIGNSVNSSNGEYTSAIGKTMNLPATTGTFATSFGPWNVTAGIQHLPEGVIVQYTDANGHVEYLQWDGKEINISRTTDMHNNPPLNKVTSITSTDGSIYLSGGTMTINAADGDNSASLPGLTYAQLQGLGDYGDISGALTASQADFANPTSSNNANTITSLQTYFNSIAQPTQQQYSTDSSNYQTEESAFAQFLQAPITQEQQMTTAMQSAGN